MPAPLPIDGYVPGVTELLRDRRGAVLVAPPGAGKTTRVPPALVSDGPVFLLQPRRVAARSIARRIAWEQGWTVGREVGWHVRFEREFSPQTRLLVATEGILTGRLQSDPLLSGYRTVVLDEFHERSVHADLAVAFLREALEARDDLRVLVMSATLEATAVAEYLGGVPVVEVPGRPYPVEVEHAPGLTPAEGVRQALDRDGGHVLCFLPGAAEIRSAQKDLQGLGPEVTVLPLHGALDAQGQDAALAPTGSRKVILATNIAETSLTVDGVTVVVDSGWHKVLRFDAARGIDRLVLERIPLDSAEQRAGRAGRTGPGRALRLWDPRQRLRPHREPEVHRADLVAPVLEVLAWGAEPERFRWFEPPSEERVRTAVGLLEQLGATKGGRLTDLGEALRRLPLHPRLGRVLLAGGGSRRAAAVCAVLTERRGPGRGGGVATDSDVLSLADGMGEQPAAVRRAARELEALGQRLAPPGDRADDDVSLRRALLAGFPDRVARRREPGSPRLALASGSGAVLARESGVREGDFLLALEVAGRAGGGEALVHLASRIEREWLTPTRRGVVHRFDEGVGAVRAREQAWYQGLVLEERPVTPDPEAAAPLLAAVLEARGLGRDNEDLLRRAGFAGVALDVPALVGQACLGHTSLPAVDLRSLVPRSTLAALERGAPTHLALPSGRRARLDYRDGGSVVAAIKLQELFGLGETPRIGPQRVPVVFELLAPNGRPVQTTSDLRSFWARGYPEVRRELRGRYPKHPWPEDPWTAKPTHRTKRRR
ncbi:MAG: ATP-dependent helicase HrpB [Acidobacteria bacterium]|nr:ATP-dependent helicase HrpB [Acidobacteriota bacterium]